MKLPVTLKGYISFMSKIEKSLIPSCMKGYENLPKELKELLNCLDADISNGFNEFIDEYKKLEEAQDENRKNRY